MRLTRPSSRDAALVELQRLHTAILASRARRGAGPGPVPSPADAGATASPERLATQALTRRLQADASPTPVEEAVGEPRSRRLVWVAVAAAVIVGAAWMATSLSRQPEIATEAAPPAAEPANAARSAAESRRAEPGQAGPSPGEPAKVEAPVPLASGAPGVAAAPAAAAASARPIQVTLVTVRPVWLRVTIDGARALQREVAAGETLSFGGDRAVVVRSGDAGAVQATLNGTDRGALGLRGWPLTVAITPTGIEPLTPTRPLP